MYKIDRFIYLLLGLIISLNVFAQNTSQLFFKHIVFFGDSLSDNGNLYRHTDGLIPKSPPYFHGRFSNGYTWAEILSFDLYSKYQISSENYAVGGATAYFHNPFKGYLPVTISMEYDKYAIDHLLSDKSSTLFCLWIGANDYLPGPRNVDLATTKVISAISSLANTLAKIKGASLLIIGLPDLALAPTAKINGHAALYQSLINLHNQKLHAAITNLREQYPATQIIEFNYLKDPIIKNIITSKTYRDHFNKTYNVNLDDVTDTCWSGGLTKISIDDIQKTLDHHTHHENFILLGKDQKSTIKPATLAKVIYTNPSLYEAYRVGQSKGSVCKSPTHYLFWDQVHPTEVIHQVFSKMIYSMIINHKNHL